MGAKIFCDVNDATHSNRVLGASLTRTIVVCWSRIGRLIWR